MPIGKSSIKRVANAGYSKVKTEAPDMENSVVAKPTPKKAAAKKTAPTKKVPSAKKTTPVSKKTAKTPLEEEKKIKVAPPTENADKSYVNVGSELPVFLL